MTWLIEKDPACYNATNLSLLRLIETLNVVKIVNSSLSPIQTTIVVNYYQPWDLIIENKTNAHLISTKCVIGVNCSVLRELSAAYLPSKLGLPRVSIEAVPLGGGIVGGGLEIQIGYINTSPLWLSGRKPILSVSGIVEIDADYMLPRNISVRPNSPRPQIIYMGYNNISHVGKVVIRFNKGVTAYNVFVVFQSLREGSHRFNVVERFFLPDGRVLVIHRYVSLDGLGSRCGVLDIEPIIIAREPSSEPGYILYAALMLLFILSMYALYIIRRGSM